MPFEANVHLGLSDSFSNSILKGFWKFDFFWDFEVLKLFELLSLTVWKFDFKLKNMYVSDPHRRLAL